MNTLHDLKRQFRTVAAQAKAVLDLAERDNRDLTADESVTVDAHVKAGDDLQREIERLEADPAALRAANKAAERELADRLIAQFGGGGTVSVGGAGSRARRGVWSTDFLKALPYQPRTGRKALLPPSGSVTVGTMLPTVGELTDEQRITSLLQLVPSEKITVDTVSYLREIVRTHAAEPVATGNVKPTSTYELEREDDRVRVIAHLSEGIPRTWLDDAPMLQQYLDRVLREGLILELEAQILQGTGVGEDFTGIVNTSGAQVITWNTNILTTARTAITALEILPVAPDAWCLHPADWENFELSSSTTGQYLMTGARLVVPVDRAARRLWGLPVSLSVGCPQGTGILAAWQTATHLWMREDVRIDWSDAFLRETDSYESTTGFASNMVQFRAELRAAFGCPRPAAIALVELAETGS